MVYRNQYSFEPYFAGDKFCRGDVLLDDLRTELAKREPMELRAVDIPHGTIVLEK